MGRNIARSSSALSELLKSGGPLSYFRGSSSATLAAFLDDLLLKLAADQVTCFLSREVPCQYLLLLKPNRYYYYVTQMADEFLEMLGAQFTKEYR